MKSAISIAVTALAFVIWSGAANSDAFDEIIKKSARYNGLVPPEELFDSADVNLVNEGRRLFQSKSLSLNGDIACATCHLHKFGSADGIPNAVAIFGEGEGPDRAIKGGPLLPRNALAFWGRGARGFHTFFWDGKVDYSGPQPKTQFGGRVPSPDPLVTAVHLPVVEVREMLDEDKFVASNKRETHEAAENIYKAIVKKIEADEAETVKSIAVKLSISEEDISYVHLARSIAAFIRTEFRLRETRFHQYVFGAGALTSEERNGALIFYGKGKCVNCHNGPHFSDFQFHAIPFPQLGFGKNGFGVDYGRFNVTFSPDDLYKFRTPPLYNVDKTAPFGHSGSVATLESAITAHTDPLSLVDTTKLSALDRHELFKRISATSSSAQFLSYLSPNEVKDVASFLRTLSFAVPENERTVP